MSNLSIQNIEILLRNETDPAKRRLYKEVIKDTTKKLEGIKSREEGLEWKLQFISLNDGWKG